MKLISFLVIFFGVLVQGMGQYQWQLNKDKDGIKVYVSEVSGKDYKAVRVECTLQGTFVKLFSFLSNVSRNVEWVYNSKKSYLLKQNNPLDFWYYSEIGFPWPLSNRDIVVHFQMHSGKLPDFFTVEAKGDPKFIPEKQGLVRIPYYYANWKVTMPTAQTVHIDYILEADPGGNVPAWLSNTFVDKGPYETFKKLKDLLKN